MSKKQCNKKFGIFIVSVMLVASACMTANAVYVTNVTSSFVQVGTSGSQWRTKATGKSSSTSGWLQAAIKRNGDAGWKWGTADSGNKINLTAYSPGCVGAVGNMLKTTDHN